MPKNLRKIAREDILPLDRFAAERKERRAALLPEKKLRRLPVGPFVTFYFENYDTMWLQVHEMLFIEKGGEAQIEDELRAYNPLIPNGAELVATMMIEIEDAAERARALARLGHIERSVVLELGGRRIKASPADDAERTTAQGKTSSVHFLHFPFAKDDIIAFKNAALPARLAIEHREYAHSAALPPETRKALAKDFA